jgi:hypothetical protein
MGIEIILNKEEGTIELLYCGYNIIKETIYNEELTSHIIGLLEQEIGVKDLKEHLTRRD